MREEEAVIDYSMWERTEYNVTNLRLDPLNPRVPSGRKGEVDQASIVALLIQYYDVYGLAKKIAEKGYFPDEVIIIFRQDEHNRIVLEGNRRIAALLLLLNPDAAPDQERARFRKLAALVNRDLIKKVHVVVAPSREDATPIIIDKHTHTSVRPWTVLMKAAYLKDMVEATPGDVEAVARRWNMTRSEFDRYLRLGKMYALACALPLPEDVLDQLLDIENFRYTTTIERLIGTPQIRKMLGLSDDIEEIEDKETFEKRYTKMIIDICQGRDGGVTKMDSRFFDKQDDRIKYAEEITREIPESDRKTKSRVAEMMTKARDMEGSGYGQMVLPKPRSVRTSSSVIPSGVRFRLHNATALKSLFDEIRRLHVGNHENVSAIALRVLLEKCLKRFLKDRGIKTVPVAAPGGREKVEVEISKTTLGPLLQFVSATNCTLIEDAGLRQTLRNFANATDYPSLSTLNLIIHSEDSCFSEEQVRNLWPPLEKLFTIMLEETGGSGGQFQGASQVPGGQKDTL